MQHNEMQRLYASERGTWEHRANGFVWGVHLPHLKTVAEKLQLLLLLCLFLLPPRSPLPPPLVETRSHYAALAGLQSCINTGQGAWISEIRLSLPPQGGD